MNELSLFTGAGGGVLGTHHLLGWKTCGYVEWNEYCQRVIAARIADGYLTSAPIFTDVREFVQSGAAEQYRGIADVVAAGFPCQPFSVAGKQLAANDERNMWPATRDVIRIVRPRSVLLENVPGLVSCGYLGTVIADLAALGYVGKWGVIGAADTAWDHGDPEADHERYRLWITASMADAKGEFSNGRSDHAGIIVGGSIPKSGNGCGPKDICALPNTDSAQREGGRAPIGVRPEFANIGGGCGWWCSDPANDPESGVGRMAPRMAYGMDRLKAIGNGQVSVVVARAWQELAA